MSAPTGKQTIRCSVTSCRFHDKGQNYCDLADIEIAPKAGACNCNPADETLCSSYKK